MYRMQKGTGSLAEAQPAEDVLVVEKKKKAVGGAFLPASQSILPETLSPDDLQAGNGLMLASRQGANLIGSAVAGVVVAALTSAVALAIDALTFLVSALSLALMRPTHRSAPE